MAVCQPPPPPMDTTKTCPDPQRVRMSSGERPIGAAKGKQSDTQALCQNPPHGPPNAYQFVVIGNRQFGHLRHPEMFFSVW